MRWGMGEKFQWKFDMYLTVEFGSRHVFPPMRYDTNYGVLYKLDCCLTHFRSSSIYHTSVFPFRMTQVNQDFRHSKDVIKELAREGAVTPPPNDGPARHYIDMSLRILAKTHIISDNRIQREFLQQQSLIHTILQQKQQDADQHFLSTREQIQDLESKLDESSKKLNDRMDLLNNRIDLVNNRFDFLIERFDLLNNRFDLQNDRLDRLEPRFDRLDGDLGQAIDASHNRLRVRGWDNINPVRAIGLDGKCVGVPDCFPKTVRKFWALKLPSRCGSLSHHPVYIRAC